MNLTGSRGADRGLSRQIDKLVRKAEKADSRGRTDEAIQLFGEAYGLLPEPRTDHEDSLRVIGSLGDALYLAGRKAEAEGCLQQALQCAGATGNPFIWLRLGECLFDRGEMKGAGDALASAYMLAGDEIFEDEDPRYLAYLRTILLPPAAPQG